MPGDPHPFLVPPECFDSAGSVRFPEGEAHHILRVVRLKTGDRCRVVDGRGGRFLVRLEERGKDLAGTILETEHEPEAARRLDLGFPVLRLRPRTDWLIEKGVEVGIDRFLPIGWERSVKGASAGSAARWERIIAGAMKQSERAWLPQLAREEDPLRAAAACDRTIVADPDGEEDLPNLDSARSVLLLVGPEGGLTEAEATGLREAGASFWGLGPTRLRAETAAIVGSHRLARALRVAGPLG